MRTFDNFPPDPCRDVRDPLPEEQELETIFEANELDSKVEDKIRQIVGRLADELYSEKTRVCTVCEDNAERSRLACEAAGMDWNQQ